LFNDIELELLERLNRNIERLTAVIVRQNNLNQSEFCGLDAKALLDLPDHLRKTMIVLLRLGRGTAEDVADQSGRARAVESAYLNQLLVMNYVKKERKGRKAYFYVDFDGHA